MTIIFADDALPRCKQCGNSFENFGERVTQCPTCKPERGTSFQQDAWQYMQSTPLGAKLRAGFNFMRGSR